MNIERRGAKKHSLGILFPWKNKAYKSFNYKHRGIHFASIFLDIPRFIIQLCWWKLKAISTLYTQIGSKTITPNHYTLLLLPVTARYSYIYSCIYQVFSKLLLLFLSCLIGLKLYIRSYIRRFEVFFYLSSLKPEYVHSQVSFFCVLVIS